MNNNKVEEQKMNIQNSVLFICISTDPKLKLRKILLMIALKGKTT